MKLTSRVAKLAQRAVDRHLIPDWMMAFAEKDECRHALFLARVPADLRDAVAALADSEHGGNDLYGWMDQPFAKWAPPVPDGYAFPRPLVEFWLCPPRRFWACGNCERCGLLRPLYMTWSNDPDPPRELSPFPHCPACGGRTTWAAQYKQGPAEATEGMP